jgi:hypothetical protein
MTRKFTNKLLEAVDEGIIDARQLAANLLGYMSEREVEDFSRAEGYFSHELDGDGNEAEEDEDDWICEGAP